MIDAILSRRSIRKYTSESVSQEMITELLKAAMAAPSARNEQPWHFVVVTDRAELDRIPTYHAYSQMVLGCPLVICVCGDERLDTSGGKWPQDCAAATENILVAAQAFGLGAVWLGVYPDAERADGVREHLGIPQEVTPFSMIAIGHPAEQKPAADRYNPERVHRDRW